MIPTRDHGDSDAASDNTNLSQLFSDSTISSSDESVDSAPEIWDDESDSSVNDDGTAAVPSASQPHSRIIHYVLRYFLLFFQLCYHVSDRGLEHGDSNMFCLLFLHFYIGVVNDTLVQLSSTFPRKHLEFVYFCACPVSREDCIITGPMNTLTSRN